MKLSLYPGCTEHSTGIEYTQSAKAVLAHLGVETTEIDDWNCCGGAAAHCLSNLLGLALPARNVAKAQEIDLPLLVPCPGCFNAMKRAQNALTNDEDMKKRLEDMIGFTYRGDLQVKTLTNVVLDIGLDRIKKAVTRPLEGLRVASYYGCALVRDPKIVKMGDHENPMFLDEIATALGAEAIDWSYKTDCCGADLAMTHGKIAVELNDKIAEGAIEAGANCMISSCGLCQVNLDIRQSGNGGAKVPVFYFTELMGAAMDLPDRDDWWRMHIINVKSLLKPLNLH